MTFGSLFAGIGGIDLGFERAGLTCKWQVEIDEYCRRVLSKHWPDVPKWDDVRTFPPHGVWDVDCIAGGFPCQDISQAGTKVGISGERSGLWTEFERIICTLRPRFVVVENVAEIVYRGLGDVLGSLAAAGFDAEWQCLPAAAFGSPQRRDRLFVVAYRTDGRLTGDSIEHRKGRQKTYFSSQWEAGWDYSDGLATAEHKAKTAASRVCGMDDGVPNRVHRLASLGNAVVPQIAEWIGRRLMAHDS